MFKSIDILYTWNLLGILNTQERILMSCSLLCAVGQNAFLNMFKQIMSG